MSTATQKHPPSKTKKKAHRDPEKVMSDALAETSEKWRYQGTWSEFKGKARRLWGDLTDDDFAVAEGSYEEIIGRIQSKSGEDLDNIRTKLFHS